MTVYFDNAATTPLDPRVFEAMAPFLKDHFGNPSSIHSHGRAVRSALEKSRSTVADILDVAPAEIFFTSGGTEADNTIINNAIASRTCKHAISSKIEHHAVLHTLEHLQKQGIIELHFVDLDENGQLNYDHLEKLLRTYPNAFVSLMHANNEIGNITDMSRVGELCNEHKAYLHSDTVQSIGHSPLKVTGWSIDAIVASAHKFHGPKGVGFMFLNAEKPIFPMLIGGGQERNMRGGTENVAGIIGLTKALEIAASEKEINDHTLRELKSYTIRKLEKKFPNISFNGMSRDMDNSLDKILSISIPNVGDNDMLLFNLDIQGISISGGSACTSGTSIGSHVLDAMEIAENTGTLRVSFSKYNKTEEVDFFIDKLQEALTQF